MFLSRSSLRLPVAQVVSRSFYRPWHNNLLSFRYFTTSQFTNTYLYEVMGVDKDCSLPDLKAKYRELCKKYHPDRNNGREIKFVEIGRAYQLLKDNSKRKAYDEMSLGRYTSFVAQWKIDFDVSKEQHINVSEYMTSIGFSKKLGNKIGGLAQKFSEFFSNNSITAYTQPEPKNDVPVYDHVHVCIDTSGSMKCTIDKCLKGLRQMCKNLPSKFVYSLTTFSDEINQELYEQDRDCLDNYLDYKMIRPEGNTALYDTINKCIEDNKARLDSTLIIVLTDGSDNYSKISLYDLIAKMKEYNVNIVIITIDFQCESLKELVASSKNGKLINADSSDNSVMNINAAYKEAEEMLLLAGDTNIIKLHK